MKLAAIIVLALSACSPVARISANTNAIRTEARALIDHGQEIGDTVVVDGATRIDGYAGAIHGDLARVEDKTPAWLSTLQWWGVAIAVAGIAFLVWQSGIGTAIRIAIGWLPRKKVAQAELAVDMLDPQSPEGDREYIAFMRSQDAEFDAAFRKASAKRHKKGTTT